MKAFLRVFLIVLLIPIVLVVAGTAWALIRQGQVAKAIQSENHADVAPLTGLGSTASLKIVPLYEAAGDATAYQIGHGVSYLIVTDQATVLLDLGNRDPKAASSPLAANMQAAGVTWDQIDALVISHPHPDHMGGQAAWQKGTIAPGDGADLSGKTILAPVPLTYSDAEISVASEPRVIAPGVATMGALPFLEAFPLSIVKPRNVEQTLAVNVAGEGIVLISGCGHPELERIVARAEALFVEPVVGIVGGLHYGQADMAALQLHIAFLATRSPKLVALSPHDSGPQAIGAFRTLSAGAYREIQVGEPIVFGE